MKKINIILAIQIISTIMIFIILGFGFLCDFVANINTPVVPDVEIFEHLKGGRPTDPTNFVNRWWRTVHDTIYILCLAILP